MRTKTARFRALRAVPEVDPTPEVAEDRPGMGLDGPVEGYSHGQWLPADPAAGTREAPYPPGLPVGGARRPHGVVHGYHAQNAIALANLMGCDTCVLAAIKKKNPRHPLACRESRKHARCSILDRRQTEWVAGLVEEIRNGTGQEPTAIQRGQVEQIIRLRGRLFALEIYMSAAGIVDVRTGEPRAILERSTSLENAIGRATGELRSSIAAARDAKRGGAPSLAEYLAALASKSTTPLAVEDARKESFTPSEGSLPEEGSDGE